jgi:hypothetical protein
MRIHNLYVDASGETHFRDIEVEWVIINLDAGVRITASDGESRVIGAGEVSLVEDTTGQDHLSKAVDDRLRHCMFVPVDER